MNENNNIQQVFEAVKQLENIRLSYVSTERILFICEQSIPVKSTINKRDEIMDQSENNMMAYTKMFNQVEEVTYHE